MLTYAHYWLTKMPTTLKSIYDRLNENDQTAQVLKDKAHVEKDTSPHTGKRDSRGVQLGNNHVGPSRSHASSLVESSNSPKRIQTGTSSRTYSVPLHDPYQSPAQGIHFNFLYFILFYFMKVHLKHH